VDLYTDVACSVFINSLISLSVSFGLQTQDEARRTLVMVSVLCLIQCYQYDTVAEWITVL